MRVSAGLPIGVAALLGGEARQRRTLEADLVKRLEAGGFEKVILPILDYFEPYEPLLTSRSREELYRFVDRDGQLLALRGDFTPMLARLLAPTLESDGVLRRRLEQEPLAYFYRGDVIRFQEARPGRLREYYQIGAEVLGPGGREADRMATDEIDERVLWLFFELLRASGNGLRYQVTLGLAGALDRLLLSPPDGLGPEELAEALVRRDREVARLGGETLLEVVETGIPSRLEDLGDPVRAQIDRLLDRATRLEREFSDTVASVRVDLAEYATNTLDPTLHFEHSRWTYYDGLVFRAYPEGSALPVGQGGRYDRLFRALGADVPAVGFQVGVDRILQARRAERRGQR